MHFYLKTGLPSLPSTGPGPQTPGTGGSLFSAFLKLIAIKLITRIPAFVAGS
jgi:hypothetical protein